MKKFVTTLIALLMALSMAIFVSACGDEHEPKPEQETYEQVTEDGWKKALSLFTGDAELVNLDGLNLAMVYEMQSSDGEKYSVEIKVDYANKNFYLRTTDFDSDTGDIAKDEEICYWEEDGTVYAYQVCDYKDGNVYKSTYTEERTLTKLIIDGLWYYTSFSTTVFDVYNSYSDFVYNEGECCYSNTFHYGDNENIGYTFNYYFKDGKAAKLEINVSGVNPETGEEMEVRHIVNYVYGGVTITVPEEDNGNDESYEQVNDAQWKNALSIFTGDAELVNLDGLNFVMVFEAEGSDGQKFSSEMKVDYANKKYYCSTFVYDSETGNIAGDNGIYYWEEDGTVYSCEVFDSNLNKSSEDQTFSELIIDQLGVNTSFSITEFDVYNRYSDFVFDEEACCYTHTYTYETFDYTFSYYFKDGKVAKLELIASGADGYTGEELVVNYVETYVYGGVTITVPEEDDGDDETYEQVTEDGWKNALSLFTCDPELVNLDGLNLAMAFEAEGTDGQKFSIETKVDYANKKYYCRMTDFDSETGDIAGDEKIYYWEEDGTVYSYEILDSKDGNTVVMKGSEEETFSELIIDQFGVNTYHSILVFDVYNRYSDFDYDEETCCYSHTYTSDGCDYTYYYYFKDGKVAKLELIASYTDSETGEEEEMRYVETYVYGGATITVPNN